MLVSWDQIQQLTRDLALRIRGDGFEPDIIIALGRGGWIPGRLLSDYLDNLNLTEFKVEHYRGTEKQATARVRYPLKADAAGQRVLLVDDVTDTGDSLEVALEHIRSRGEPAELRTLVLHHKLVSPFVPDYFGQKIDDWRWVIYPWAMTEDLSALIRAKERRPENAQALTDMLLRDHGIQVPVSRVKDVLRSLRDPVGQPGADTPQELR
jgi:hypoxanthine phosphoribosyltransferase